MRHREEDLFKREREIQHREKAMERRQPELDIALAKAEGMEWLVQLLQSKLSLHGKPKEIREIDNSSSLNSARHEP